MTRRSYTHYGVRIGRQIGVFTDWSDCAAQVSGYSGQCYRGFYSYREAFNFAYGEHEAPAQFAVGYMSEAAATPEPETVTVPEPETVTTPEPKTVTTPEPATVSASEPATASQPRTVLDAEPGHQEPPPAKKARHSQGKATETISDTQENTLGSSDIVDEAGESSSSATEPSETVYNDIRQAKERLLALMEGVEQ
ncbi:hypothetical protein MRS44_012029 [Fusarium solani]|uniref:uncharacterized protein n=1 Tax=Fusarium solani TaxID=169388 RepID=UPI0032C43B99|nr:hypothetical protein MRS44_012029 [Fusarium solani]